MTMKRSRAPRAATSPAVDFPVESAPIDDLKPHPQNYKNHPEDQLLHLEHSIRENGFFKNVVVARENTILAGHGVVLAAKRMRLEHVPVRRLDLDPGDPRALKILAADNEIANLAETDDRALTEILRNLFRSDEGLLGSGFDEKQLAALAFVTRPASEIADADAAAHWLGMPSYTVGSDEYRLVVLFKTEADRDRFTAKAKLRIDKKVGKTHSTRWPWTDRVDGASVAFQEEGEAAEGEPS
jgi:hypothetical protein